MLAKLRDPSEKTLAVILLAPAALMIALIVLAPMPDTGIWEFRATDYTGRAFPPGLCGPAHHQVDCRQSL